MIRIPEQFITERIINIYLKRDSETLLKIPESVITKEIVMKFALSNLGFKLKYVPAKFLDKDVCIIYAARHTFHISEIPKEYWTEMMIIKHTEFYKLDLESVPEHLRTDLVRFVLQ